MDSNFEKIPLSQLAFPRTWEVIHEGLKNKVAPGFAVGLWQKKYSDQIQVGAWGNRRESPTALPLTESTPFDLASLTKVIGTAPLIGVLVDRGWLNWDTPVGSVLNGYSVQNVEVRHLLSHTAGYIAWKPFWEDLRRYFGPHVLESVPVKERQKAMKELVLGVTPDCAPGTKAVYSDVSFLLLGFLLEEVTRLPLDQAIQKWLWGPMRISGFYFRHVSTSSELGRMEEVAATEVCPWRGLLQGQVHDDNCWAMGGYGGHAGAFGRVEDVLQFVRRSFDSFFTPSTLETMWTRVSSPLNCGRTLGWDTPSEQGSSAGRFFSRNSVGHLGFTGTSLWIDLEAELAVVLLSNRVHPSRENKKIQELRPRFHEAIRLDIGDQTNARK